MDTLTIDRATSIDALFSFIGAERVTASRETPDRVVLTPDTVERNAEMVVLPPGKEGLDYYWPADYPDPKDYDNDTDYLCAIPGMAESIIAGMNAPENEFEDWDD